MIPAPFVVATGSGLMAIAGWWVHSNQDPALGGFGPFVGFVLGLPILVLGILYMGVAACALLMGLWKRRRSFASFAWIIPAPLVLVAGWGLIVFGDWCASLGDSSAFAWYVAPAAYLVGMGVSAIGFLYVAVAACALINLAWRQRGAEAPFAPEASGRLLQSRPGNIGEAHAPDDRDGTSTR